MPIATFDQYCAMLDNAKRADEAMGALPKAITTERGAYDHVFVQNEGVHGSWIVVPSSMRQIVPVGRFLGSPITVLLATAVEEETSGSAVPTSVCRMRTG